MNERQIDKLCRRAIERIEKFGWWFSVPVEIRKLNELANAFNNGIDIIRLDRQQEGNSLTFHVDCHGPMEDKTLGSRGGFTIAEYLVVDRQTALSKINDALRVGNRAVGDHIIGDVGYILKADFYVSSTIQFLRHRIEDWRDWLIENVIDGKHDIRLQRALNLWNSDPSIEWKDVCFAIDQKQDRELVNAFKGEVQRYAKRTKQKIRKGSAGQKRKQQ